MSGSNMRIAALSIAACSGPVGLRFLDVGLEGRQRPLDMSQIGSGRVLALYQSDIAVGE